MCASSLKVVKLICASVRCRHYWAKSSCCEFSTKRICACVWRIWVFARTVSKHSSECPAAARAYSGHWSYGLREKPLRSKRIQALDLVRSPELNIVTIEDPVEYQLDMVNQIHVHDSIGLTFARALRSILRQDPDVIMVGEIRDDETARVAVQAALTGHLVLATLHTNDAPGAVARLLDMNIEPYLLSSYD